MKYTVMIRDRKTPLTQPVLDGVFPSIDAANRRVMDLIVNFSEMGLDTMQVTVVKIQNTKPTARRRKAVAK